MELDTREWLRLHLAFGVTNAKKWEYIDIKRPSESLKAWLSFGALRDDVYVRKYKSLSSEQLDSIIDVCERHGILILTPESERYPKSLLEIANPPSVLFVLGDAKALSSVCVAVVGARECCEYSAAAAGRFAYELADAGLAVVSGFARGTDSAAHEGALEAEGTTIAVLGNGILYDYPHGSMPLKRRIAQSGAVISEYLPTAKPAAENFKVRNRLLSGLCDCVLVTEASSRSGALNTAGHAAEQGKEVFVVPPSDLFDERFLGQSALLRDGATLALSPSDLICYVLELYDML